MEIFRTRRQYPAAPPEIKNNPPLGDFLGQMAGKYSTCGKQKNHKNCIQKHVDISDLAR